MHVEGGMRAEAGAIDPGASLTQAAKATHGFGVAENLDPAVRRAG